MGAGEGGVDELAGVGGARGHVHVGGPLDDAADLVDVGQVEHGVDALAEEVEGQGHQVHVAGALAVAEQAALDAVSAGHEAELGGGHARAAVVVVVQGQAHGVTVGQVSAHPLDLVGVDVGGSPLNGGGKVEDDLAVILGLPHVHDGLADLKAVVELGVHEDLRGVLVAEDRVLIQDLLSTGHDLAGAVDGELADLVAVHAEDDVAEQRRQGVVEVDGGPRDADAGVQGAVNEFTARLGEHGDGDVLGDRAVVHQGAHEVVVGLGGGGEADLDLLEAHVHEQVKDGALCLGAHGLDEGLVAVAQVGAQPAGGLGDALVRPGAVGQVDADDVEEGPVLGKRHTGGLLGGGAGVTHRGSPGIRCFVVPTAVPARDRKAPESSGEAERRGRERGRAGRVSRGRGAGLSGPAAATKQEARPLPGLRPWSRSHGVDPTPTTTRRQVRRPRRTAV